MVVVGEMIVLRDALVVVEVVSVVAVVVAGLGSEVSCFFGLASLQRLVWCLWWHILHLYFEVQALTLCFPKQLKQRLFLLTNSLRAWLFDTFWQSVGE